MFLLNKDVDLSQRSAYKSTFCNFERDKHFFFINRIHSYTIWLDTNILQFNIQSHKVYKWSTHYFMIRLIFLGFISLIFIFINTLLIRGSLIPSLSPE